MDINNLFCTQPRITVLVATALISLSGWSSQHDISDAPLFVLEGVDPNILLTMDDSGSMAWSFMPNAIDDDENTKRAKSAVYNKIYYNPEITYDPPVTQDGTGLANASFTAAWDDGFKNYLGSTTCTVDLSTSFRPTWGGNDRNHCYHTGNDSSGYPLYSSSSSEPAYYYLFDGDLSGCNGNLTDDDCYYKVVVSATSGPDATDERTNFANWYSYYRKRVYVNKTSASRAFADLGDNVRVGYRRINSSTLTGVLPFTGTPKTNFFNWVLGLPADGGTPLRKAVRDAGEYFEETEPYLEDPTDSNSEEISCRQNFHIVMTDGDWNGGTPSGFGNVDNNNQTLPGNDFDITSYTPRAPYKDSKSTYLADIAFRYWHTDLRSGLANNVPTNVNDKSSDIDGDGDVDNDDIFWNPKNDPASWQHMVNFTIGLGVSGERDYPDDYDDLLSGDITWPTSSGASAKIDDLWHAAINSRGDYLSAQDSEELVSAFSGVINSITDRTGSFAPVALNSGTISSDTALFFARFETNGWIGHLIAHPVSNGTNCGSTPVGDICSPSWDAACGLTGGYCVTIGSNVPKTRPNDRIILTRHADTGAGIPFRWSELPSSQKSILKQPYDSLGGKRLNYLRGARGQEISRGNGGIFRNRQSILGDIIFSNPTYVDAPNRFYKASSEFPEASSYGAFKLAYQTREPIVYVGANDGMLHGFRASDGREVMAYVPEKAFNNIWELSKPDYIHQNFVDGPISENDVYYSDAWHSVLVSGLGLGGQSYFALDITDTASFSEANAASIVRWQFSDINDADLGYSFSKSSLVRLANGRWGVIAGNGINSTEADGNASTTGNAVIFILDIEDGSVIKKLDTKVGSADDPESLNRPNGIIGTSVADLDGDLIADRIFAGDLFGNVWAFDISSTNTSNWKTAYGSSASPEPLFVATQSGNAQPITTDLQVGEHPTGDGVMVYFGTGQYLGQSDLTNYDVQTFYGIWDRLSSGSNGFNRSRLLEQTITTFDLPSSNLNARVVTNNPITWDDGASPLASDEKLGWYIDLPETGERVHQTPTLRDGRMIFTTATPSDDPCQAGGTSWLMEVNAVDGSRFDYAAFDLNNDNEFNDGDRVNVGDIDGDDSDDYAHSSGIQKDGNGILTRPTTITHPTGDKESKMSTTSFGSVDSTLGNPNANLETPWREIR